MRGMLMSRIARWMSSARRALDGLGAVGGLGDDLEVGLGVDHVLDAVSDQRVVVGDEDPADERGRHAQGLPRRDLESHLDAAVRAGLDRGGTADDQRAFTDAAQPAALHVVCPEALAVVDDPQHDAAGVALSESRTSLAPAWRVTFVKLSCATR